MNAQSYKVVFSKRQNALVAVGENATAQGKAASGSGTRTAKRTASGTQLRGRASARARLLAKAEAMEQQGLVGSLRKVFLGVSLLGTQISMAQAAAPTGIAPTTPTALTLSPTALPTNGVVTTGAASIATSGANMQINQTTDKASINWNTFNVGSAASVNILQNNSSSVLLNRVIGSDPSQIMGKISANGQVMLINPNGVVFGNTGSVTATSFTASTMALSDADFQAGNYNFQRNGSTAGILNQGSIKTNGGYVALLGATVTNDGTIATGGGDVVMAAGERVSGISVPVSKGGKVKLVMSPADINTAVTNTANGVIKTDGGQVLMQVASVRDVLASINGSLVQNGTINTTGAQGGAVTLRADGGNITVHGNVTANSTDANAKGGDIIIGRADGDKGELLLADTADVSGATLESKGGFVETSGHRLVTSHADGSNAVKVLAKDWLLDPYDIEITDNATLTAGYTSKVAASTINTALNAGTAVTIQTTAPLATGVGVDTTGDPDGMGNILVSTAISKSSGANDASLTLIADNGIDVNANITASGAGTGKLNVSLKSAGGSSISKGITVKAGTTIDGNGGNVSMDATYSGTAQSAVTIAGGAKVIGGAVTISGISMNSANTNAGVSLGDSSADNAVVTATSGDVVVTATNNGGYGIALNGANVTSTAGKVNITSDLGGINVAKALDLHAAQGSTLSATNALSSEGVRITGNITATGNVTIEGENSVTTGITAGVHQTGTITTDGAISIKGKSTGTGYGVLSTGGLTSTGGKNITVEGIGAAQRGLHVDGAFTTTGKTLLKGSSTDNYGVRVFGGLTATGDLEINGTSGNNTGIQAIGTIKSTNGAITLTGETGGASGSGFAIDNGSVIANGSVTINAKSTNVANTASALHLDAPVESENGSITINAAAAGNTSAALSVMKGLKVSGTNEVNLNADTLSFAGGSIDAGTTGFVNINTLTPGNQIHIGAASTGSTTDKDRVLGLDGAALNSIKAGTLTVGNPTSTGGDVTVSTTTMSGDNVAKIVNINSGGKITVNGTFTTAAATDALRLTAQQVELTKDAHIAATAGATNVSIFGYNNEVTGNAVSLAGGSKVIAGGAIGITARNLKATNTDATVVLGSDDAVATLKAENHITVNASGTKGIVVAGGGADLTSTTKYVQFDALAGGMDIQKELKLAAFGNSVIRGSNANGDGVRIAGNITSTAAKGVEGASGTLFIEGNAVGTTSDTSGKGINQLKGTTISSESGINMMGTSAVDNGLYSEGAIKGDSWVVINGITDSDSKSALVLAESNSVKAATETVLAGKNTNALNSSSAVDLASKVTSTGGDISVTATSKGASEQDLLIRSDGGLITTDKTIRLNSDTMDLAGTINAGTAGTVMLDTATAGNQIDLGGANVGTTTVANRVLGLGADTLKKISTGTLTVGSAKTGDVKVGSAGADLTGSSAKTVNVFSGGTLKVDGLLKTNATALILGAQKVELTSNANIAASAANVTIAGVNSGATGNAVSVEGGAQIAAGDSLLITGENTASNTDAAVRMGSGTDAVTLTGAGTTTITGIASAAQGTADGVQLAGNVTSTRAGAMEIAGAAAGKSGSGVEQTAGTLTVAGDIAIVGATTNAANPDSAVILLGQTTSTGGSIGVLATSLGASASDLELGAKGGLKTTDKAISLNADTMDLDGKINAGTGAVSLDTATEGSKIALGGSNVGNTDTAKRVLGLQGTTLNAITAGTLNIGSAKTGDVSVAGVVNMTDSGAKAVNITSGGKLTVDGTLTTAATTTALNLVADQVALTKNAVIDADLGKTNVALTGENANAKGNAVNVAGDAKILAGGSLAVKGTNTDARNTDAAVVMGSPTAKATLTSVGAMSVEGTGTQGSGVVVNTATLNSGGALDITGTTSSATAPAVVMAQGSSATAAGNIKLVGDSLNTAATGGAIALAAPVKSTGGTITVVATSKGTSDKDLAISGAGGLQTTNKDIVVNADTMSYAGTGGINAGTGKVTLATASDSSKINVGGASQGSATAADRVLGLSADLLKAVTAGTLDVGSTTTKGDVLVSGADMTGSKAAAVNINSGGKLTVDGTLTTAAATTALNLNADQVALTKNAVIDADLGKTNVALTGENANATGNAVNVAGDAKILAGGSLAVKGTNTDARNTDAAVVMGTPATETTPAAAASLASNGGMSVVGKGTLGSGVVINPAVLKSGGALGIEGTTASTTAPAVVMAKGSSATAAGDVSLTGTNTNTAGTASAIDLAAPITSTGGTITVQAINAGKSLVADLAMSGDAALKTTAKTIALIADTMSKTGTGKIDAGTGLVKLGTYTAGNKINVGGANVADVTPKARELGLSSDLLKAIAAGQLDIGSSTGGDVTVSGADMTGGNATEVNIKSGGKLTVSGPLITAAATKDLNLSASQVVLTRAAGIYADAVGGGTNVALTGVNGNPTGNAVNVAGGATIATGGTLAVKGTNTAPGNTDAAVVMGGATGAVTLATAGAASIEGNGTSGNGILVAGDLNKTGAGDLALTGEATGATGKGIEQVAGSTISTKAGLALTGTSIGDNGIYSAGALSSGGTLGITGKTDSSTKPAVHLASGGSAKAAGDIKIGGTNTNPANNGPTVLIESPVASTGGKIDVVATSAGASTGDLTFGGTGGLATSGKDINLNTDTLAYSGTGKINAGTGTVNVASTTGGNKINVGGESVGNLVNTARVLGLSTDFLKAITADTLNIGDKTKPGAVEISNADLTGGGVAKVINVAGNSMLASGVLKPNAGSTVNYSPSLPNGGGGGGGTNSVTNTPVPSLPNTGANAGAGGRVSVGVAAGAGSGAFQLSGVDGPESNAAFDESKYSCSPVMGVSVCMPIAATAQPGKEAS